MTVTRHRVEEQVMHILLDGADTMNSLTPEAVDGLETALDAAEADDDLRAVVITGAGDQAFCVGIDITYLGACFGDPEGVFLPFIDRLHALLQRIERLSVPVIARVNGLARAGGFEILLACDLVVVAADARVGDIHLEFGVPPGAGASQRAARKLGDQRAKALMLTSMWLDGPTMVEWGLALSSVPRDVLDDEVERLLASLRGRSRPAIAVTKWAVGAAANLSLAEGLRHERELFARHLTGSPDAAEGYLAYVEKRRPHWGGPMSVTSVETGSSDLTPGLVADLIETGGYTHPLFHARSDTSDPAGPPLPGQAVLLLAGGLVEQSGLLDDAVAMVEIRSVRFMAMVRAGARISVRIRPGHAKQVSAGRWIQEFGWQVVDGQGDPVLEATVVMLMNSRVEVD
ncbi:enoyl-CoA hydratase-related protein [Nocardioides alcanivorans]|uniref:enoyl-CoA hydratase-related protein n=1 Tax=Nocardioides alcanivorans TaxID=2897352 RepID=UPI001F24EF78|nr:enoyl-CoA hydratase-related protein [Nocardioides alcanivorans]